MEPDIIRMYSSSPPPLDNGAEDDDDDEFGEFGGFSEVSPSGIGFVDFDAPDFTHSKEEFIPSNHFMPIHDFSENVDSLTSFKSMKNGNDKEITAELSTPVKGQSDVLLSTTSKEIISSKTLDTSIDGMESPGDLNKVVEQKQNLGTPESFSLGDFRTDTNIVHQNKQLENCNGEKPPCPEVLTNGFTGLGTVNPHGTDDLDSVADSEEQKPLSTPSTEYNLDSAPSPAEGFADFATFSKKERIQLEEISCAVLNDRGTLTVQENNKINRVDEVNSIKGVSLDRSFDDKGDTDGEDTCVSEISIVSNRGFSVEKEGLPTLQSKSWSLVDSADDSEAIREQCRTKEELDLFSAKCADLCMDFIKTSDADEIDSSEEEKKFTNSQTLSTDPTEENVLGDFVSVKNGESSHEFVTCSDTNEDDFGDFGTASGTTPPLITGTQDSMSDTTFEESLEHFPHFSEPGDDFGEFGDTNATSCQEEMVFSESDLKHTSDSLSEECQMARKSSEAGTEPVSKLKNGQDSEFGDFDSVPNIQDDCNAFQDSDDFADFSSAGPSQVVDWNAFEDEQKDDCSWAAFGDQQATEAHHRKEVCQSHRTDENIETLGTPKMRSAPLATSRRTVASGHLQESATSVQTALLNRLEQIFEGCFPSISVPDAEEEVTSLKHLLETSTLPIKTREALAESGELLDVWTELQDIHDAHGLRYQWGGSHSNKKLLCSLGIDTRNILFTGNKKQPVIVPMYAAGLGMLEPTKEPLKPLSAAEKIASIGQTTTMTAEMNTCTSDQFQESLPPVQFDWSSSGLTNPLDASGGSTLLNLDFFGPVDDSSSSSSTTIPGVDPELYELTTSKLEISTSSLKVTDAFARLMSTVEKTSTSTRKPKREEHLSEEAIKVIASLPDLTFMHAKVLMFPATLTPSTSSQGQAD
ncbi:aftiphilin isoform X2 [Heterocephalus glaber]|uniref:Aftiphilin isoform X2 n=1 Tax=Heterocephalus glaber TaxID=10181 RepID=A0AAX6PDY8_HETGA|nr:aftiphilin isoform X2 [Heterocephalus glaber]XP_004850028.1 aftiphilin isoform X2 [Heterocephalus glaber]XP_012929517.1 aftiphilin isoform X2 [Heterocephalus glaber]XP_021118199.1 aftiphilin isoform X2 [Heterocephalus glaber]